MGENDKTVYVNYEKENQDRNSNINPPNQLDKLYMELGKAYYEGAFEEPLPQLLPLFDKITRVKNHMQVQSGFPQAGVSRRADRCPRCGHMLESDAVFCGVCGHKVL